MNDETKRFIDDVHRRAGDIDHAAIETGVRIVLRHLGTRLESPPEGLGQALSGDLAQELLRGRSEPPTEVTDASEAVGKDAKLSASVALELTHSVLAELALRLGATGRVELRRLLPDTWAERIVEPSPASPNPAAGPVPLRQGEGQTLATARPGATQTLADGHPAGPHSHSIATNHDPHADTKIGSTHGVHNENNLAHGKPGSKHSIADHD